MINLTFLLIIKVFLLIQISCELFYQIVLTILLVLYNRFFVIKIIKNEILRYHIIFNQNLDERVLYFFNVSQPKPKKFRGLIIED